MYLRGAQVADPELETALSAFRRAANVLARLEDRIIFTGQQYAQEDPFSPEAGKLPVASSVGEVLGGEPTPGLFSGTKSEVNVSKKKAPVRKRATDRGDDTTAGYRVDDKDGAPGELLVKAISEAVGNLEKAYHLGPFGCVLGQEYFTDVQTPNRSMVLPQDRILPFLGGGALLRSSVLAAQSGVVIALGGAPIDLVVGTDVSVSFLQVTPDPWFVFRVYEKMVLRIKQSDAIVRLVP